MEDKYLIKIPEIDLTVEMNEYQKAAVDGIEIFLPYVTEVFNRYEYRTCYDLEVSNLGNVRGTLNGEPITIVKDENGRRRINSYGGLEVYLLVDKVFNGKKPHRTEIHHVDFDKGNDSLDNLIRLSRSQHTKIHMNNVTDEYRKTMSEACMGEKNGFYNHTHTEKTCKIISEANKGNILFNDGKSFKMFKSYEEAISQGYIYKGRKLGQNKIEQNGNI